MERWADALIRTGPDREKQNMLWNISGSFCYAFASMVLSFLVMRLAGAEQGGIFAIGFSTVGQQMFLIAYFGIRPFQITDGVGEYRFGDYLHHRYLTCGAALAAGVVFLCFRGYQTEKAVIILLLIGYKVIDGFADVYESEFQRQGRLYLTGKSNTFRTILSVGVFLIALIAGNNLVFACAAAVCAQVTGVVLFDVAVLRRMYRLEHTPEGEAAGSRDHTVPIAQAMTVDYGWDITKIKALTAATVLLFVSVFLDFYVFSASKYAIDSYMDDASSGYFNMIFMPTSVINLAAGFVIRPFLTYLTVCWNEGRFRDFAKKMRQLSIVIGLFSVLAVLGVAVLGRQVLGILELLLGPAYAGKLTRYNGAFGLIVLGGGFYAILNLHYYALVIMRRQKAIFGIYLALTAAALWLAPALVKGYGILGAAWAYLLLMAGMAAGFVILAWLGFVRGRNLAGRKGGKD